MIVDDNACYQNIKLSFAILTEVIWKKLSINLI